MDSLNRFEDSAGTDYGFGLRSLGGLVESRHEIFGHLFGYLLGIPLGESRDAVWGYNPTELFALLWTSVDILRRAKAGDTLTPDEISYLHAISRISPWSRIARFKWWLFGLGRVSGNERDIHRDYMRQYYFAYYAGRNDYLKALSAEALNYHGGKAEFNTKQNKKFAKGIHRTLMKNQGTTPLDKEWMQVSAPSMASEYSYEYFRSFYPERIKDVELRDVSLNRSNAAGGAGNPRLRW